MVFISIHSSNDKYQIKKLNDYINKGKPTFILIYMEGCGPCNETRPEWKKLENVLSNYAKNENIVIADVDQELLERLPSIKEKPMGFPTILYLKQQKADNYEGGRTIKDFVEWIKEKTKENPIQKGGKRMQSIKKNLYRKTKKLTIKKSMKKQRQRKTRKIKKGGLVELNSHIDDSKFKQFYINNVEIIFFIMDFFNKTDLKNIVLLHHHFINTIEEQYLNFNKNPEYRAFVNNIIQWFLLDYNKDFLNSILEIIKNTLMNPDFLNKNINLDERYNILLENVYSMISKYNNKNVEIFILLEIIFRALQMPNVRDIVIQNLKQQEDSIISFKNTIVCLLEVLIKEDLIHNPDIRKLLKELIENLTYNNVYSWEILKKILGLVRKCSLSITSEVSSIAAKNVFNKTSNAAKNLFGKIF